MALLTTPDGIATPASGQNYALVTDLAATAGTVQTALTQKANYGVGTTAERTAALGKFPNGAKWYDTTLSAEYRRVAGSWAIVVSGIPTYDWADAAARTAQTGMLDGYRGYQRDTAVLYRRVSGAWVIWGITGSSITLDAGVTAAVNSVEREGKVVTLSVTATRAAGWSTNVLVGTLPVNLRPAGIIYVSGVSFGTGTFIAASIASTGAVNLISPSAGHTVAAVSVSFVVA